MLGRIKLSGGSNQAPDLLVAVEVRSLSMVTVRKQPWRGDFGPWIQRTYVMSQATHHSQAIGPLGGLAVGRLGGPFQRQLRGNNGSLFLLGKSHKDRKSVV